MYNLYALHRTGPALLKLFKLKMKVFLMRNVWNIWMDLAYASNKPACILRKVLMCGDQNLVIFRNSLNGRVLNQSDRRLNLTQSKQLSMA